MIYFIAYLIKGEAEKEHRKVSHDLSRVFKIKDPNKTAPPHLTIKAPFRTDRIEEIENVTNQFVKKINKARLKLEGFGSFGEGVIFVDAKASDEMKHGVKIFLDELRKIKWLEWKQLEEKEISFHATLAKRDIKHKFNDIMNYLKNFNFSYECEFDNITILKHENGKWHIHKEYPIQ